MARPATAAVRLLTGEREPVRLATTGNITLSGLQTIDGYTTVAGDRVLVRAQTDESENRIYNASAGDWYVAPDSRTARMIQKGTTVYVQQGTQNAGKVYVFETLNPEIGTDAITLRSPTGVVEADIETVRTLANETATRMTTAENAIDDIEEEIGDLAIDVAAAMAAAVAGAKPRTSSVQLLVTTDVATTTAMEAGDTFDGFVLVAGWRIAKAYLTNGAGHATNGIWIVQSSGAAVRATDFDTDAEIRNSWFKVEYGSHAGEYWGVKNTSAITVDTTAIVIDRIEAAFGVDADLLAIEDEAITQNQKLGVATKMASKVIGLDGTPANGTASANAVYVFSDMAGVDGRITELWAYGEVAGTVEIRIYSAPTVPSAESAVSSLVWERTYNLNISVGVNTWSVANGALAAIGYPDGLPISKNERVGWYGFTRLSFLSPVNGDSGGYHPITSTEIAELDPVLGQGVFSVQLQFGCRIEYPEERIDLSPPWMVRPGYEMVPDHDLNGQNDYGQSNSVGADNAAVSTTPSVRHYTFNVGTRMTKPGINAIAASGVLADDMAVKLMVEDNGIPETATGATYGETSGFGFISEYSRRALKSGTSIPIWFYSAAGRSGYALSGGVSPLNGIDKLQPNSVWYPNLIYHIEAAKREADQLGLSYQVAFCGFDGLETDTLTSAPYALVLSRLRSLSNNFRVDAMTAADQERRPIWFATTPIYCAAVSTGAIKALMDVCEERKDFHFVMPGYRLPGATNVHYSAIAQHLKGAYRGRAAHQYAQGLIPDRCWWRTVRHTGMTVTAVISHPGSAITFNTAIPAQIGVSATTDYGIKIVDDTGTLGLSGLVIGSSVYNPTTRLYDTEITMTIDRLFGTNPMFRYALDYQGAGHGFTSGADGNIYDNTSDTVTIDGTTYVMAHGAPPCELAIIPDAI